MKGGVAVALQLAADAAEPNRDVTYVFYECEEVEAERNGLSSSAQSDPELLPADFAILMEPTQRGRRGRLPGHDARRRTHHAASGRTRPASGRASTPSTPPATVLARLDAYEPRTPVIDGLEYHEGLNAVGITGGVAGNVLPDECVVAVNYRFAPDRPTRPRRGVRPRGLRRVRRRRSPTPRRARCPGSTVPGRGGVRRGRRRRGRTRSSAGPTWPGSAAWACPAVNFGPGDPHPRAQAGRARAVAHIVRCEEQLRTWLGER